MVTSYLLSSTFVPVMSVWLLDRKHEGHAAHETKPGFFALRFSASSPCSMSRNPASSVENGTLGCLLLSQIDGM